MQILPHRHPTQKPRVGTGIDWQSALSRGLVLVVAANEMSGPPADIAQRNPPARLGNAAWSGDALTFADGSSDAWSFGANPVYGPGLITLIVSFTLTTTPGGTTRPMVATNTGVSLNTGFKLQFGTGGTLSVTLNLGGSLIISHAIGTCTVGTAYTVAFAYDGAAVTSYLFSPAGVTIASTSGASALGPNGGPITLGNDGVLTGNVRSFGGQIRSVLMWNRALSAAEIARIAAEPYLIYRPSAQSRYGQRGPSNLGTRIATDFMFSDAGSRAMTLSRTVTETLFSDGRPGGNIGTSTAGPETLFTDTGSRNSNVTRFALDNWIFDTAFRPPVASAPGVSIPTNLVEGPLFSDQATRVYSMPRTVAETLFTDTCRRIAVGMSRIAAESGLFTDYAFCTGVRAAGGPNLSDPFLFSLQWQAVLAAILEKPMLPVKLLAVFDTWGASLRQNEMAACAAKIASATIKIVGGDGTSSMVFGTGDEKFIVMVAPVNDAQAAQAAPDIINAKLYKPLYEAVTNWLNSSDGGVFASIDAYLTAQNTPTKYVFLVSPDTAYEWFLYANKNQMLSPANVFAPQTVFGTAAVSGVGAITFTDGAAIPITNNVGGGIQGYAPSVGITITMTTATNGTLTARVTYDGVSAAGVPFVGHTVDIVLDNKALNAVVTTNPLPAGERISNITAIATTGAPSTTTGAFNVSSIIERVIV